MKSRKAIICVILFWGVQHFSCKTSMKDELKNKQFKGLIVKKKQQRCKLFWFLCDYGWSEKRSH
jgi:hypothetical protein